MPNGNEVLDYLKKQPEPQRSLLLGVRDIILDIASKNHRIGQLEETFKWGQPSYLPKTPKTGTTLRIDADKNNDDGVALYVNCQSSLVSEWRGMFPHIDFGGDRSVHLNAGQPLPEGELRQMIDMALTYHIRKKTG